MNHHLNKAAAARQIVSEAISSSETTITPAASTTDDENLPSNACLICYSEDIHTHRAIAPCGHDDLCGMCHLRLRALHLDTKCPICKADNEKIIVDADAPSIIAPNNRSSSGGMLTTYCHKPYKEYPVWGDELGGNFIYRDDVCMFFREEYYKSTVIPLFSLSCSAPNCDFTSDLSDTYTNANAQDHSINNNTTNEKPNNVRNKKQDIKRLSGLNALREHLKAAHGRALCNLCVEAKRDFVSLLPRMTPNQLKVHLSKGDGVGSGFVGHPVCEFCRPKRFYDLTKVSE